MWFQDQRPRPRIDIVLLQRWTRLLDCVKLLKLYFYEMFFYSNRHYSSTRIKANSKSDQPEFSSKVTRSNWDLWQPLTLLWPSFLLFSLFWTKVIINFKSTKRNYNYFDYCFLLLLILIMNLTHNCCWCSMHTMSNDFNNSPMLHPYPGHHHHSHQYHHPRHNPHHHHYQHQHQHQYHHPLDPQSFRQTPSSLPLLESTTGTGTAPHSKITVQHLSKNLVELAQTKCIARCSCKWRSGKMWVECPDANLHHVPKGLDSGTQVLYLSGNPLSKLEARAFERVELRNLQRLYLVKCHLTEIHGDTFQQLSNLIELDLSQNELQNLPTNSLQHCPILRKLNLANNRLTTIPNRAFNNLEHLQAIDFSANQITTIEKEAFFGLKNLKHLYLHDNRLRYIDGQTMKNLPTIYELTLHHNPWNCDCSLRTFREWMLEHRIPITYSPNCSQPERLNGSSWTQLLLDEFACPPMVVNVDTEVVVYEGENASIGCIMKAIPNVNIEWEWRGRTIRNMSLMTFGRQMYLIRESYSSAGVMMSLLPVDGVTTSLDLGIDQHHDQDLREHPTELDSMQYSASLVQLPSSSLGRRRRSRGRRSDPGMADLEDNLDATYTRQSTLYIMNALEKDSGSYVCIGYNKAGTVSANVTLTVLRRLEVQAAAYSGQEVAGIVIGALVIFILLLIIIISLVLRSRKHFLLSFHHRSTNSSSSSSSSSNNNQNCVNNRQSNANNNNRDNQTVFGSTTTMMTNDAHHHNHNHSNGSNGRIPNGHIQTLPNVKHTNNNGSKIPNGTLRKMSSSNETTTAKQATNINNNHKSSNLMVVSLEHSKISSGNNPLYTSATTTNHNNQQCQLQHFVMMDNNNQIIPNHVDIGDDDDDDQNNSKNNSKNTKMNIINNHLLEQIELCDYSTVNDSLCSNARTPAMPILDLANKIPTKTRTTLDSGMNQRMNGSGQVMTKNERISSPISMASVQSSSSSSLANNKYPQESHQQQYRFSNGSPVYQILDQNNHHHHPHQLLSRGQHHTPIDDGSITSNYDYVRPSPMMMMVQPNQEPFFHNHHQPQPRNVMTNASSMMMIVELQNRLASGTAATGTIGTVTCSMKRDIMDATTIPSPASLQKVVAASPSTTSSTTANSMMMMEMNPIPSSDQVVRFARTPPTVYSYSTSPPTPNNHTAIIQQKQANLTNPLNRLRNNGANPIVARDSPDEGLGEEAD